MPLAIEQVSLERRYETDAVYRMNTVFQEEVGQYVLAEPVVDTRRRAREGADVELGAFEELIDVRLRRIILVDVFGQGQNLLVLQGEFLVQLES